MWGINFIYAHARQDINRTAEGAVGIERIDTVASGCVHMNCRGLRSCCIHSVLGRNSSAHQRRKESNNNCAGVPARQLSNRASHCDLLIHPFQPWCHCASTALKTIFLAQQLGANLDSAEIIAFTCANTA